MKFIVIAFCFLTVSVHAYELSIDPYIKMQDALAFDDFKSALEAHKSICEKESTHLKKDYKNCGKDFKDIEELRTSFKFLSEVYLKNVNPKEIKKYQKATCSMAKAQWIQKPGPIRNPYYGKSMLECGEKI